MDVEKTAKTRRQILAWAAVILPPLAALLTLGRLARAANGGSRAAPADTYVVTSTADPGDGVCDENCTLREAIDAANDADGPDRITFDLPDTSFIGLNGTPLPTIEETLTIDGSQTPDLWVSGNSQSRVFQVRFTAVVTFAGLNIGGGSVASTGAGIYNSGGTVTIQDSLLSGNHAGFGGAIYNRDGELTVVDSIVSGNSADATGGGIGSVSGTGEATLTILNSQVIGNLAQRGAGLYFTDTVTINSTTFDGNDASDDGGAIYANGGQLEIGVSTFAYNVAGVRGGGLYVQEGTHSISSTGFFTNSAIYGGALYNIGDAAVTVEESSFQDNGGSDLAVVHNYATLSVAKSTFIQNSSALYNSGMLNVVNSTFSGNEAGVLAGGLHNSGAAVVDNSTFSNNEVGDAGGGLVNENNIFLRNTIVANSVGGDDCRNDGTFAINVGNLVEDGTCDPALTGDPMLGALADNDGATLTRALLPGSPAIDAADQATCQPADQRGADRPLDGDGDGNAVCDVGALEMDVPLNGLTASNDGPSLLGQATTLTAHVQAGSNVTYNWTFGDGNTGSGSQVTHTYAAPGTYTPTVTATNTTGSATATATVSVRWPLYLPLLQSEES